MMACRYEVCDVMRDRIRNTLAKTPFLWRFKDKFAPRFPGSATYWNRRYQSGGNSGPGSYGRLARFKAEILNGFIAGRNVQSVIEFGCGDGAQLESAKYPKYIGLDISANAIGLCKARYLSDDSKSFFLYDGDSFANKDGTFTAELGLSLDVIYHLIEDRVFERYMQHLFTVASRFVIVYSSNHDEIIPNTHVRHRKFSDYVAARFPEYSLIDKVEQRFPMKIHGEQDGSFCDFYIYGRI